MSTTVPFTDFEHRRSAPPLFVFMQRREVCDLARACYGRDKHCSLCKVEMTLPLRNQNNADLGIAKGRRTEAPSIDAIVPRVINGTYVYDNLQVSKDTQRSQG